MTIAADLTKLSDGSALVELFKLDLTALGGGVYGFSPDAGVDQPIIFGGFTYIAFPIKGEGFDQIPGGEQRPTITVSNVMGTLTGVVQQFGDLVGATLIRQLTLVRYLDAATFQGAPHTTGDPSQFVGLAKYQISQKTADNSKVLQWELTTQIDRLGQKFPKRQVLRDHGFPGVSRIKLPG